MEFGVKYDVWDVKGQNKSTMREKHLLNLHLHARAKAKVCFFFLSYTCIFVVKTVKSGISRTDCVSGHVINVVNIEMAAVSAIVLDPDGNGSEKSENFFVFRVY